MAEGDGLQLDDGRWLKVQAAMEDIVEVRHKDPISLCALHGTWEIGICRPKFETMFFDSARPCNRRYAPWPRGGSSKGPVRLSAGRRCLAATAIITTIMTVSIIMSDQQHGISQLALLRQQSWLSPAFPTGSYSYSHGIEWAVEAGHIHDRKSLVDWLEADLCYGSGRNEAIFLIGPGVRQERTTAESCLKLLNSRPPFGGHRNLRLKLRSRPRACLATLRRVWPDPLLETFSELLAELRISPVLSVVLGLRAAKQDIPATLALPAFLQSYLANLITAGVRLVPLGQTDGQLALAELEPAVLAVAAQAQQATIYDLGSVGFMVDLASALHETQYTRLFRS